MFRGLSNEEVFEMLQNGNKQARGYLVESNMKLVYYFANRYRNYKGIDYENLLQEASIGLIKAVDGFEPKYGIKFSTYASSKINSAIWHYMRDGLEDIPFRIKRDDRALHIKIQRAKDKFEQQNSRKATVEDISEHTGMGILEVERIMNIFSYHKSMEETIHESKQGTDITKIETIENHNNLSEEQLINKMLIRESLNKLQDELRKVIELRYFRDLTQSECGQVLNITQVTVSRREKRALQELRKII